MPSKKPIKPGPGQESVWDYPRPPALEPVPETITVVFNGQQVARTTRAFRVLETSHPPVYYLPPEDILPGALAPRTGSSFCEWKGKARYFDLVVDGKISPSAAWAYDKPTARFANIAGYVAFYPSKIGAGYVNEERARAQAGDFYGGWITDKIVGPFKGEPGTWGW
jgi:uncharacterized protein (DUF427 family)